MQFRRAGVLDVTRLLFKDGIQLNGLPAPHAEPHRRLFALPPRRPAVSTLPPNILNDLTRLTVTY
jgi:hypothetical protein